jgi:hypothetical protein
MIVIGFLPLLSGCASETPQQRRERYARREKVSRSIDRLIKSLREGNNTMTFKDVSHNSEEVTITLGEVLSLAPPNVKQEAIKVILEHWITTCLKAGEEGQEVLKKTTVRFIDSNGTEVSQCKLPDNYQMTESSTKRKASR